MTQNLVERLQEVINLSKEALAICQSLDTHPNWGLEMMGGYIKQAEQAQVSGDVVAMIQAVKNLEGYLEGR